MRGAGTSSPVHEQLLAMSPNRIFVVTGANHYTPMQVKKRGTGEGCVSKMEPDAKAVRELNEKTDNREYLAQ